MRYSWTQPQCFTCWNSENPHRTAARMLTDESETEICVTCNSQTQSGIYIRIDPSTAPHPTLEK